MKLFHSIIVLIFAVSCHRMAIPIKTYPDCSSKDIAMRDTCLLGLRLFEAIETLGWNSDSFFTIVEPVGNIRGIIHMPDSLTTIRLLTGSFWITDQVKYNPQDSLLQDSLQFRNLYKFILNNKVVGVTWTKDGNKTFHEVYLKK